MSEALLDANLLIATFGQWNDAYLIALARKHRLPLATLDRKMENMDHPGATVVAVVQ